jgi:choline/glycine/proline betaine transport protein
MVGDWRTDLDEFLKQKESQKAADATSTEEHKPEAKNFLATKVLPAFEELKAQLEKNGRTVSVRSGEDYANIAVVNGSKEEIDYSIKVRFSPLKAFPQTEERFTDEKTGKRLIAEGSILSGAQDYDVNGVSKDDVIADFLRKYKDRV